MSAQALNRRKHAPHARRVLVTTARTFGLLHPRTIQCIGCGRVAEESDILKDTCERCAATEVRKSRATN